MEGDTLARRVPLATSFGRQLQTGGSARGAMLSAVLHAGLIALLLWKTGQQFVDASRGLGPDLGRGGGGGGGGAHAVAMFAVPGTAAAPPAPVVETPTPPPITVPQEMPTTIPDPAPLADVPAVAAAPTPGPGEGAGTGTGAGPGSGTGSGGGTGGGVGTGTGNDSGPGGGGGSIIPPSLQGILIPPTDGKPRELRGVRIKVTFFISERGEVVSVETEPQIQNRGYRNEFLDRMRHYAFTPGFTRDGQATASKVSITITL